ncbi:energy-coupling factor transport system ATP-binding protein [Arthrobacter sp. CAN_A214]|uniref:ABC transporter ATP-binding protein n=1 Tax=Arthrobacter sp. CAN_A214 TaxID=2787720 RepID=UPI0018C9BD2A
MTQHTTAPVAVTARNWGWRHAGRSRFAVRGIDLEVEPGERILLLGASGAGKSTLLSALAGVLGNDDEGEQEGTLLLDGGSPASQRGRAGLVLQDPDSQVVLARVGDEVAFGAENLSVPRADIWERVHRALDDVGLNVPLDRSTSALSGGQKQRLALASVLAMQPGLLLLDEPTANLDPQGVIDVRNAVVRVLDRVPATLVVVEHRVEVWAGVVDRVVVLAADGGILADGTPEEILGKEAARCSLAEAGVWVPGRRPAVEGPRPGAGGEVLLSSANLAVARTKRGPEVLAGVDVELRAASALSIVGPNGAGKSTLALTLAGLLKPRRGEVTAGTSLARGAGPDPSKWRSAELVQRIGTVFQEPEHQFLTSTVADELEFGPRRVAREPEASFRPRIAELAGRLRLDHLRAANPFTLSGGEKRRLSVATMLATSPDILVLDEPTFGQDAGTWAELVGLLRELVSEGGCVVSVTHDTDFTEALGNRVLDVGSVADARRDSR